MAEDKTVKVIMRSGTEYIAESGFATVVRKIENGDEIKLRDGGRIHANPEAVEVVLEIRM